jgi:tyrosine-protein phosphatase SIW14
MRQALRWILGVFVALAVVGVPALHYRNGYASHKRFRVVTPGKLYRSGEFTAESLRKAVQKFGIKSVINLQQENTDPFMPEAWLGTPHIRESELCRQLGVKYFLLDGCDKLVDPAAATRGARPAVIDQYLALLDDPTNYPILLHCKAGLHRTGRLTAIYRMEYEGWTLAAAMRELRANGYGTYMASTADQYIVQYVNNYRVRGRGN